MLSSVIVQVAQQWPSLAILIVLGIAIWTVLQRALVSFWAVFQRSLEENKGINERYKVLLNDQRDELQKAREQSSLESQRYQEESNRNRASFRAVQNDYQDAIVQYRAAMKQVDDLAKQVTDLSLENKQLKRGIDRIEELSRATGGETKMISLEIQNTRQQIKEISEQLVRVANNQTEQTLLIEGKR